MSQSQPVPRRNRCLAHHVRSHSRRRQQRPKAEPRRNLRLNSQAYHPRSHTQTPTHRSRTLPDHRSPPDLRSRRRHLIIHQCPHLWPRSRFRTFPSANGRGRNDGHAIRPRIRPRRRSFRSLTLALTRGKETAAAAEAAGPGKVRKERRAVQGQGFARMGQSE